MGAVPNGTRRRTTKTVSGSTTQYLYDGLDPVQELQGTPSVNLLTGLGIDEYFRRVDANGPRDYLTDALGSPMALADGSGTVQTEYTYEPFGAPTTTGASTSNTITFTGRETDGTGLMFYRMRYFDPRLQRFVSEDPVALPNSYNYVLNSPVLLTDPLGLCPDGTHEARPDEIKKILSAAGDLAGKGCGKTRPPGCLSYQSVVCNQFVARSINAAFPGAVPREYTVAQIGGGQGPFAQINNPEIGVIALFNSPGHVTLITQVRNGKVVQFVGSQTSTGPAYVNLPDYYWQRRFNEKGNVRYYKICLPN